MTSIYPWAKAFHLVVMAIWIGGMVAVSGLLPALRDPSARLHLKRWYAIAVTPAMLVTLALGLFLAQDAGLFAERWLQAKLALVILMTGFHGVISGQLRRSTEEEGAIQGRWLGRLSVVMVLVFAAIAVLVVVKPL